MEIVVVIIVRLEYGVVVVVMVLVALSLMVLVVPYSARETFTPVIAFGDRPVRTTRTNSIAPTGDTVNTCSYKCDPSTVFHPTSYLLFAPYGIPDNGKAN